MISLTRRRLLQTAGASAAAYSLTRLTRPERSSAASVDGGSALKGVSGDFVSLARERSMIRESLDAMTLAGVTTLRFPVIWEAIQPKKHVFNFSLLDDLHRELTWFGLDAVPVVVADPTRWQDEDSSDSAMALVSPGGADAIGLFAARVADYFQSFGDRLAGMELLPVPGSGQQSTATSSPKQFAEMVAAVEDRLARRSEGASVPVIAGGIVIDGGGGWIDYIDALAGSTREVAVGVQIPAGPAGNAPDRFREAFAEAASRAKTPIWLTAGAPACETDAELDALTSAWVETASDPRCVAFFTAPFAPAKGFRAEIDGHVAGRPIFDGALNETADGVPARAVWSA